MNHELNRVVVRPTVKREVKELGNSETVATRLEGQSFHAQCSCGWESCGLDTEQAAVIVFGVHCAQNPYGTEDLIAEVASHIKKGRNG